MRPNGETSNKMFSCQIEASSSGVEMKTVCRQNFWCMLLYKCIEYDCMMEVMSFENKWQICTIFGMFVVWCRYRMDGMSMGFGCPFRPKCTGTFFHKVSGVRDGEKRNILLTNRIGGLFFILNFFPSSFLCFSVVLLLLLLLLLPFCHSIAFFLF